MADNQEQGVPNWRRSKPNYAKKKCAFLSPWVSPVVVPLRHTERDTNRLNGETRE